MASPDIVLTLLNGEQRRSWLTTVFKATDEYLRVNFESDGLNRKCHADEIAYIQILEPNAVILPAPASDFWDSDDYLEEVETLSGERLQVRAMSTPDDKSGFFAYSIGEVMAKKWLFIYYHGIRMRHQYRPMGEILESSGFISASEMQDTLDLQSDMKKYRVGDILAEQNRVDKNDIEGAIQRPHAIAGTRPVVRVGEILIAEGLVTREQVDRAISRQKSDRNQKIGTLLIEQGLVNEEQILSALSTKFRMRFLKRVDLVPDEAALRALPTDLVYRLEIFPLNIKDNTLTVVTSKPADPSIGDVLRFSTNRRIELAVATSRDIAWAIQKYVPRSGAKLSDIISQMGEDDVSFDEAEDLAEAEYNESDSQIIQLSNKILIEAYQRKASDIHFEPGTGRKPLIIRYRVDGICHEAHRIPANYKKALISRLKILSNLDIAERRRPQSGKIFLKFKKQPVEYRIEVTPTVGGNEDAVVRILSSARPMPLSEMGFSEENLARFSELLTKPYGIILCVGPTGSGKTTTLHSSLRQINTKERKIWTVEDPVEITQEGLRQVQVQPKIGFTFQEALRSFLRADPDVIMIGEMRDSETAKIAVNAALTGHLVFSTLHTNSAPETIIRLIEMKIDPLHFSDAFLGILAQRLTLRLCDRCKQAYTPSLTEYQRYVDAYGDAWFQEDGLPEYSENLKLMRSVGCKQCGNSGYRGRIALHELLAGTRTIKKAIKQNPSAEDLTSIAVGEGMRTLKMDGIQKIFQGVTDFDQVLRVCQ